ncbi:hypothetical protein [Mycolicibacterium iranicum]|nr:hypothetical protein [Mycolicibacterium iranicum]
MAHTRASDPRITCTPTTPGYLGVDELKAIACDFARYKVGLTA